MPTDLLRKKNAAVQAKDAPAPHTRVRRVLIRAGAVTIRAELAATPTADRIWSALPLFSTAERWGGALHFETPIETGRDRTARTLSAPGDICFWVDRDRVIIAFGPTPISRPGELRLPNPCNVWANALDDVTLLKDVAAGEKVSVTVV